MKNGEKNLRKAFKSVKLGNGIDFGVEKNFVVKFSCLKNLK